MSASISTDQDEKGPKVEAEKKFDQAVYGGISYFAQAATGIVLASWIRDGGGRKYFDVMSRWVGPRLGKLTGKTGEEAIKAADTPIVITTMIGVGTSFLIPVKMIENHKPQIVRKWQYALNEKREKKGKTLSPEERAEQEALLDKLDKKPKQTWGSLLQARAASLVGVYAVLFGIGTPRNIAAENYFANTAQKGMKSVGLQGPGNSKTVHNYLKMVFNDGFYSAVSAGGLYVWSHFVCPPKKEEAQLAENPVLALEHSPEKSGANPSEKSWCPTGRCVPASRNALLASALSSHRERVAEDGAEAQERQR